jgi:hypothetical protein
LADKLAGKRSIDMFVNLLDLMSETEGCALFLAQTLQI